MDRPDVENYHRQAIAEIERRARQQAQPHIDALIRIEMLKPGSTMRVKAPTYERTLKDGKCIAIRKIKEGSQSVATGASYIFATGDPDPLKMAEGRRFVLTDDQPEPR